MKMEQEVENREQKKVCFSLKEVKMKIAICEKDKIFLTKFKNELYRYAEARRLDMVVDCYLYGEEMLRTKINYNIVFLGYCLAGENGLEIAKKMRLTNDFTAVIFISEYTEFVFETFKVRPYRFLVPPVNAEELYAVLDEFFEEYARTCPMWVKCGEDTVSLNTGDIVYLEADNKHCRIHLCKEELRCNRTMARVNSVLPQGCFGKINRAYIVNFNHIKKYNSEKVLLTGGYMLHISRNYLKSFKAEYRSFLNPQIP